MSDVISIRVKRELKKRAEELGINIREIIEEALERAIREKEKEILKETAMKIKELMRDVSEEDWVSVVRESRDEK
ncbi:MAG: type II toxin-antitoxin system CcdA family antitoxin [Sulfolobaceae archaeon]